MTFGARTMFFLVSFTIIPLAIMEAGDTRMASYDVTQYDLSIAFDLPAKSFTGRVIMSATTLAPISEVVFNASVSTLTIDSVLYKSQRVRLLHDGDIATTTLPSRLDLKTPFELTIYYHGVSKFTGQYDGGGVYIPDTAHFTHVVTSSEPNFARTWWPCKDSPEDKAPVRAHITVPVNLIAASNGLLKSMERKIGTATYHWETRYPIATYLVSVAIAPYVELHDTYIGLDSTRMPITYYVYPNDTIKAKADFQNTTQMLGFFARHFCEYPFFEEKFGYAEVDGSTTMENQTLCSIETQLITGTREHELTLLHEMAHHWWGDLITPATWNHTWLSEGFATYAEALYLEETKGAKQYHTYIDRFMSARIGTYAGCVIGKSDTAFWDSFAPRVYFKGALVLHMLRGILGDSIFFAAMRNYVNEPALRYATARTEDFIRACENTSGTTLQWFFDEWVYASADSIDRPVYEYFWTIQPGKTDTTRVSLTIKQPYAGKLLYRMPMSVSVWTQEKEFIFSMTDSLANQDFTLSLHGKVDSLQIDRQGWVFKSLRKKEGF
ncbi:MAG: M1 family metallopeptidase [Ignavibacteriae bacterium]|nr:M1 family metallopeptidase [Ignavibacteria bacterium]MBI3363602.1 M1 family metallopeptidase [Ignavibacteriota bacterium]